MRNRRQIRRPATIQAAEREEGEAAKTGNARMKNPAAGSLGTLIKIRLLFWSDQTSVQHTWCLIRGCYNNHLKPICSKTNKLMLNYKASDACDVMKGVQLQHQIHTTLICPSVRIIMFDADQENVQTSYFLYTKYQDFCLH